VVVYLVANEKITPKGERDVLPLPDDDNDESVLQNIINKIID